MHNTLLLKALISLALLTLAPTPATAYVWPDPLVDDLEAALIQVSGFDAFGFADAVNPCSAFKGAPNTGRQTAAEWLRVAYHDMSTHDVTTGLGGLDASIQYETGRPENIGAAMAGSLKFFLPFMSVRTTMSDLLALGAVVSMRSCGSTATRVPLRAGRIDAKLAGPFGVPQPQEGLDVHARRFAMQGFNVTEMIGLVVCGHTIGGVHQVDFPNIVSNAVGPENQSGQDFFDVTPSLFDNNVATLFVQNKSVNPLVIGPSLTNSDARIFGADGGAFMRQLASSNDDFLNICTNLVGRMIDTVPNNIKLSDPITVIPVKPVNVDVQVGGNDQLTFSGAIRLAGPTASLQTQVQLHYQAFEDTSTDNLISTFTDAAHTGSGFDTQLQYFAFNASIPAAKGIKSFWVEIASGGQSSQAMNGGGFFPVQDIIIVQRDWSCVDATHQQLRVITAVRNNAGIDAVTVSFTHPTPQTGSVVPTLVTTSFVLTKVTGTGVGTPALGYDIYEGVTPFTPLQLSARATFDVIGTSGGNRVAINEFNNANILPSCQ